MLALEAEVVPQIGGQRVGDVVTPTPHVISPFLSKGSYLPTMPGDLLFDEENWKIGQTDKMWSKYWGDPTYTIGGPPGGDRGWREGLKDS